MSSMMAMDWLLVLNATRVTITVLVLLAASYLDIKTRMISNKIWIFLGLVAISLFECQLVIEFGYEAFQYLIVIVPIMVLFMSFLVCDYIIDFEQNKINHAWIYLMALVGFAFVFQLQFGFNDVDSTEFFRNYIEFAPIMLLLVYLIGMELLLNRLDYNLFLRLKKYSAPKQRKKTKPSRAAKSQPEPPLTPDEQFGWMLFFTLVALFIIVYLMSNVIMFSYARSVGLAILIALPVILFGQYLRYHSRPAPGTSTRTRSSPDSSHDEKHEKHEKENDEEPKLSSSDLGYMRMVKLIDRLLYACLIIFGFILLIVYSVFFDIDAVFMQTFSILIWILIFYGFYNFGLPRGGADTKALMTLAILFPVYPILEGVTQNTAFFELLERVPELGIEFLFPFAFTTLMNAALIMIFFIIGLLIYNIMKGTLTFPQAVLGYKLPLKEVQNKFVWPMEQLQDGKRVLTLIPARDLDLKSELAKFRKAGIKTIWVTPKIPFMIPLTIGLLLSVLFGNLIFDLIVGLF